MRKGVNIWKESKLGFSNPHTTNNAHMQMLRASAVMYFKHTCRQQMLHVRAHVQQKTCKLHRKKPTHINTLQAHMQAADAARESARAAEDLQATP